MQSNPFLRGFHPDPSWVRVDGWTYLTTSTFGWLPGLPLYRSRDHRHWEPLPPAIADTRHLDFSACACDDGLYAPGIRHDGDRFLLACTLVHRKTQRFQNFICTSENPVRGWSPPVMLPEDIGRIDPTPFVDDDQSLWLVLNDLPVPEISHGATRSIRLWQLNPDNFEPIDGPHTLWHGAMLAAATPEAPRIFKRNGWYWLLIAEGGTGTGHAVTMARSRAITGPYENCPANPLLTHRHLGPREPVRCVGHADLLQMEDGSWRACCLAERQVNGHCLTGRESWSVPVDWREGEWPVFAPGIGKLVPCDPSPAPPSLDAAWIGLRQAPSERLSDVFFLTASPDATALVGRRITAPEGSWRIQLTPKDGVTSHGIALFATDSNWLKLERNGSKLTLHTATGVVHASCDVPPAAPLGFELTWHRNGGEAAFILEGTRTPLHAQVPLHDFAKPVFAGGVAALFALGDTGGVHLHPCVSD